MEFKIGDIVQTFDGLMIITSFEGINVRVFIITKNMYVTISKYYEKELLIFNPYKDRNDLKKIKYLYDYVIKRKEKLGKLCPGDKLYCILSNPCISPLARSYIINNDSVREILEKTEEIFEEYKMSNDYTWT